MAQGTVKWFNAEKGFGFISPDGKAVRFIVSHDADPLTADGIKNIDAIKQAALNKFEAEMGKLEPSTDTSRLAHGRQVFVTYCAPCHREDGGGLVGPNLCDDYWIHGPKFTDNLKVIVNGVPDKGMLTWRGVLPPADIADVASFIYTLRGTKPPNPKMREDLAPKNTETYE